MSNNRNNSRAVYGGVGVFDVLQLVFIVLKLCGVITWSWWWVLSPTWLVMLAWVFLFVFAWIAHKLTENSDNKGKRWEIWKKYPYCLCLNTPVDGIGGA